MSSINKYSEKKIAVIGSGMIGSSLAVLFTAHGVNTTVYVLSEELKDQCIEQYGKFFKALEAHGLVTEDQERICRGYLHFTEDYAEIADSYMVFECASERTEVKYSIYRELEKAVADPAAIVSTTSAISADDLAEGMTKFKEMLVVAHPYFPPHLVSLVEIIRSRHSGEASVDAVVDFLEAMDRQCVVLRKSAPGFIGNRLLHSLLREAVNIVEEGIASPEDVDKVAMNSFMPRLTSIGLFEHLDNSGLDLNCDIENYLFRDLCNADKAQDLLTDLAAKNELGVKTGKGIYEWPDGSVDDLRERLSAPYWKTFCWDLPEK